MKTANREMNPSKELWYTRPANNWDEALPVGNGRMGAMIFGKPEDELLQLNEDSIWSGNFRNRNNPKAYDNLEKIRKLISEGKTEEAEAVCSDAFYGTNENQRHYQPLGDLHIWQNAPEYSEYKRGLSLEKAVSWTNFTSGGVKYTREVFASHPDECIIVRFTADKKGSISFTAAIDGRDDNYDKNEAYDDKTVLFTVSDGIPYACAITVTAIGGECGTDANRLVCHNADEAMLIIAAQTSFRTGEYEKLCVSQAKRAARMTSERLLKRHMEDYSSLFDRCSFELSPKDGVNTALPTDERLKAVKEENAIDNELAALYFNFSRYLMISGSREGTLPLNLQGIWNKDMWPAWGGKYTVNINTEMNYWGAEIQNLSECHTPLFDHIERMRENGRVTARTMYHCGGTVCHHNTDIWGDTAPQDKWLPATLWPMGMAWLCTHIWEHYLFTGDKDFLAEKFDTLCEAAEFFADFLTEDEKGRLVTNPSVSPENTYYTKNGKTGTLCKGPSMDSQILNVLFTAVISSSEILGERKDFADKLRTMRDRLPKPEIGKYGQIMEWAEDYDEVEPGHRHISQLYALYPADMITPADTPELAKAARATLERRLSHGGGHTGWSRAWIINMWARLHDGEKVGENIQALLAHSTSINMFDMHPPFQIDGNFGGGAGIAEAVMQSRYEVMSGNAEISLLPALPPEWKHGSVRGMKARGGFTVHFDWSDGRITKAELYSDCGNQVSLRVKGDIIVTCGGEEIQLIENNGVFEFDTEVGKHYSISAK
ncbi:MAG: glycoside hydrolase family 95 protein [Oscillospiraceae bacterium]|nr:glycoside hydrolase family 95 protein [Oscillospiraceae bacterium]MDY6207646.1 glycoside hydrolase family 95 protein [Oscillospiraceae bacterium]